MIHYLKIKNFGPIREEVEISFDVDYEDPEKAAYEVKMADNRTLLKLAYIYGANASGKTTVLKAFDFLRQLLQFPVGNKASDLDFNPFLFCEDPYQNPSFLELSFYYDDIRYVYEIHFNTQSILNEKLIYYKTIKPTELFVRTTDVEKRLSKIHFGSSIKVPTREKDLLESNTLHNNTVFGAYARTNVDIPEMEGLNKWFGKFLMGMMSSNTDLTEWTASEILNDPNVNKWMNTYLFKADDQIKEVIISKANDFIVDGSSRRNYFGPKINFIHNTQSGKDYVLSIDQESNGSQRYFGLGGPLYRLAHDERFLCIDELETSLHPDLMKHFLQTFLMSSGNSQLLITTHNTALMEDQDFIRRDCLWFTEKGKEGEVHLYSAAEFDTATLRKDASIVNAYRAGRLGGKPNLGSPFIKEQ